MTGTITEPQRRFINDLLAQREVSLKPGQTLDTVRAGVDQLSKAEASAWIDRLKEMPKLARTSSGEPDAGMYKTPDGTIWRVYLGQNSGRMLVKRVVQGADELVEQEDGTKKMMPSYGYEYVGAASRCLPKDAERLSFEEATHWGKMTSHCCVCGRRLDVPESVDAGIGPVCGGRMQEGDWS